METKAHLNGRPALLRVAGALLMTLALAVSASAQRQQEGEPIDIEVGEQASLSAEGVRSYSEGRRGIADVRLTRDQSRFVIVGQAEGTTSLLLIMSDGSQVQHRITVTDSNSEMEADPSAVDVRENIRLDLYFVQLSDSYSHDIGIAFPASLGTAGSTGSSFQLNLAGETDAGTTLSYQLIGVSFLPRIDLAQNNGWARIYRQGTLITANGTEATFRAGGESNVLSQSTMAQTLVQVEFGTRVECRPRYDPDTGRIELRIKAEVADLTSENAQGIPGRTVTNIDTLVNLELGQSIVLAGFVARSESRARNGLPGLAQIPVLGALFGTHSRRFEESEGMMFIVPSVVDAVPLRRRNRIEEAMRLYDDFSGGVDEIDVIDQPSVAGQ